MTLRGCSAPPSTARVKWAATESPGFLHAPCFCVVGAAPRMSRTRARGQKWASARLEAAERKGFEIKYDMALLWRMFPQYLPRYGA